MPENTNQVLADDPKPIDDIISKEQAERDAEKVRASAADLKAKLSHYRAEAKKAAA